MFTFSRLGKICGGKEVFSIYIIPFRTCAFGLLSILIVNIFHLDLLTLRETNLGS